MLESFRFGPYRKAGVGNTEEQAGKGETLLAGGLWKICHKPQRHSELIQLEVRAHESNRTQRSRLSGYFHHFNTRFAQRSFRLGRGGSIIVCDHIIRDPLVE